MRGSTHTLLGLALLILLAPAFAQASPSPGPALRAQSPQEDPTPVVDPIAMPEPLFLPSLLRQHDKLKPEPLRTDYQGYLASLSRAGKTACAPATHALLSKPEGRIDAEVIAVLYTLDPSIPLELRAGEAIAVRGLASAAPPSCHIFADWLLEVVDLEVLDLLP